VHPFEALVSLEEVGEGVAGVKPKGGGAAMRGTELRRRRDASGWGISFRRSRGSYL
jgi:hypothetical protein